MAFDPVSAGMGLVQTVIQKLFRDKMSEEDLKKLELDGQRLAFQESQDQESTFRQFVVEYEGAAKDVPRAIVYLRSLIRPVFTLAVGYWDWLFFSGAAAGWDAEKIGMLKAINLIVLIFWFGEKAIIRSGVMDYLKLRLPSGKSEKE